MLDKYFTDVWYIYCLPQRTRKFLVAKTCISIYIIMKIPTNIQEFRYLLNSSIQLISSICLKKCIWFIISDRHSKIILNCAFYHLPSSADSAFENFWLQECEDFEIARIWPHDWTDIPLMIYAQKTLMLFISQKYISHVRITLCFYQWISYLKISIYGFELNTSRITQLTIHVVVLFQNLKIRVRSALCYLMNKWYSVDINHS